MLIKISSQKVYVSEGVLNETPILIKLENTFNQRPYIVAQLKCYYESDVDLLDPFMIPGLPDQIGSEADNLSNFIKAAKFVIPVINSQFNLQDSDYILKSDIVWTHPERNIRLFISYKAIIDSYSNLINYMKTLGAPYYDTDNGYLIYLNSILSDHIAMLEADINNVLIEYNV